MEKEEINKINLGQKTRLMLRRAVWSGTTLGIIGLSAAGIGYGIHKSYPLVQEVIQSAIQTYADSEGKQEEVSTARVSDVSTTNYSKNNQEYNLPKKIIPENDTVAYNNKKLTFEVKEIKKERNEWENTLEERIEPEAIASIPKEKEYVHQEIKQKIRQNIQQETRNEQLYTIKKGDTLANIAREFTGNLHNYKKIAEYNHISNPNRIEPGQRLMIPTIE